MLRRERVGARRHRAEPAPGGRARARPGPRRAPQAACGRRGTGSRSPSRITPVPRTPRRCTVAAICPRRIPPPSEAIPNSGPSTSTSSRSRICPSRVVPPSSMIDVAAGLDRDPVGRHLAGEVASVDRGCERQDRLLHRPPNVPVLLAVRLEPIEGIAHSVAPWRFRRNSPRATTIARPPTSTRSIESPLPCAVAKSLEGRPISAPCSTSISAPQSTSPCRQR